MKCCCRSRIIFPGGHLRAYSRESFNPWRAMKPVQTRKYGKRTTDDGFLTVKKIGEKVEKISECICILNIEIREKCLSARENSYTKHGTSLRVL